MAESNPTLSLVSPTPFADAYYRLRPATTRVLFAVMAQQQPTRRSVAEATGLAQTTVVHHLLLLERAGLVAWEPGKQRTLRALVRLEPVAS